MDVDNSNQIRDNKIILFANQKGGVGKTTICGLFSNYLSDTRNVSLLVIDADPQQTFANRRKDDSRRQKDIPYKVQSVTIKDPSSTRNHANFKRISRNNYHRHPRKFDTGGNERITC